MTTDEPTLDITVSLAVFSGKPDPKWTITPDSPYYSSIMSRLNQLAGKSLPSILGYKGFVLVVQPEEEGVRESQVYEVPRGSDSVLENLLLDTAFDLDDKVVKMARKAINSEEEEGT